MPKKLSKLSAKFKYRAAPVFQFSILITFPLLWSYAGWNSLFVIPLASLYHLFALSAGGHMVISHNRDAGAWTPVLYTLFFYTSFITPATWAGFHIQHHKYPDTERDPHSPKYRGLKAIFLTGWNPKLIDRKTYIRVSKKPIAKFFDDYFWLLCLIPFLAFYFLPFEAVLLLWAVPASLAITMATTGAYLSHIQGSPGHNALVTVSFAFGEHPNHRRHHEDPKFNSKLVEQFYD